MHICLVAFVAGVFIVTRLPSLPSATIVACALLPAILVACRWRWCRVIAFAAIGFFYAFLTLSMQLLERLPVRLEGENLTVVGTIASLPQTSPRSVRFRFTLADCADCWHPGTTVDLAWYEPRVQPRPGERWQFTARFNRPRGSVNPGLFDYEGWLLSEEVSARGYVRVRDDAPERLRQSDWRSPRTWENLHHRFRAWLRDRLNESLEGHDLRGLVIALVLGESSEISSRDWAALSDTGTNHLLIISGLHVGLVAAASFKLCLMVFSTFLRDAPRWAGIASLLIAVGYGLVAGLGLPVQRALVMTAVALSGSILNRHVPLPTMFCYALLFVSLLDPLAAIRPGFWLSFGAVFALTYFFCGRHRPAGIRSVVFAAIRTQWVVFVGTIPLLLFFVFQVSLLSFAVNLVAIPWISFTVIPFLLLAIPGYLVDASVGEVFIDIARHSLHVIWRFIEFGATQRFVYYAPELHWGRLLLGMCGVLVLLSPRRVVPGWTGLLMLLPLFVGHDREVADDSVVVRALDVGQGLAVIVQARDLRMLYDTGPRYASGFDAGESIVVPTLRLFGEPRFVDLMVVSHGDTDHAGGAEAVKRLMVVGDALAQDDQGVFFRSCHKAEPMVSHGVSVAFIPMPGSRGSNDRSCVVLVTVGDFNVLLPGDIELAGERHLLGQNLPNIDVLIAPHHGSDSSSSPGFLNHVRPKIVIFSAGYNNRFGHPSERVVDRYVARGVDVYSTARDGAITIRASPGNGVRVETARSTVPRFWYD